MKREDIIRSLREFNGQNKDKYRIVRLGVFGSPAGDRMREQSDIDVVVELVEPDLFELIGIKQDLEEQFGCPVDVIRYRDGMNAFLKSRIDEEAVYV